MPSVWRGLRVLLSLQLVLLGLASDPCYDAAQRPRYCLPEPADLAAGRPVQASATCGRPPQRLCTFRHPGDASSRRCHLCDGADPASAHPATYLTDAGGEATCWQSGPVANANLTLALGGRFELLYVALRFCSPRPHSLALYKSTDHGHSWRPFQFFSARCPQAYGLPPASAVATASEHEATCTAAHTDPTPLVGGLVAFMPLAGRPSARAFEYSPVLQDWVTATDLRVALDRRHRGLGLRGREASYGVSELRVGGRCRCNGHAARCGATGPGGAPRCQCRHNTAGPECETCRAFYCDRPWQRATPSDAHECVACECHRHSHRCRFNMELYKLSGRRSGGVCLNCRHHTAGRHCHYCQPGFKRDTARPITSRRACKACQCHPVGAVGTMCNQTTGQCQCKMGVTGLTCNRCAQGFQQSRTAHIPCIRVQEVLTTTAAYPLEWNTGTECQTHCNPSHGRVHMNLRKYCKKDYGIGGDEPPPAAGPGSYEQLKGGRSHTLCTKDMLHAQLLAMVESGEWWKFTTSVLAVYRQRQVPIRRGEQPLWVPQQDLACGCLRLQVGKAYLVIGNDAESPDPARLVLDRNSLALPWRDVWAHKLRRFQQQSRQGNCRSP